MIEKVRSAIAYHEAGHAVIARIQGVEIATIDMTRHDGRKAAVATPTAAWIAREAGEAAMLEAAKKDARVCLAGSIAQSKFQKAHGQRPDEPWMRWLPEHQ
jgi:hypothetical protein